MAEARFLCQGYLSDSELALVPGIPFGTELPEKKCAVLECAQEIPCNPCQNCCPVGAISLSGADMTNLPVVDPQKCIGCGTCIAACPGMAIFVVDPAYGADVCQVEIPYEFYPVPEVGEVVTVHGRDGSYICDGQVSRVRSLEKFDHTVILGFTCPREFGMKARAIRRKEERR